MIWLRYVPHSDVEDFKAKGWKLHSPMKMHHGQYCVLMIWEGDYEPG